MLDENRHQQALNTLKNDVKAIHNLLYLFSSYVASNPDFKYNVTYLTDQIDIFLADQSKYRSKIKIFKKVLDYTVSNGTRNHELDLFFDAKFHFNTATSSNLEISERAEFPNPNEMSRQEFLFKIASGEFGIEYTYLIKLDSAYSTCCQYIDEFIQMIDKTK